MKAGNNIEHEVIVLVHSKSLVTEFINNFEIREYPLVKTSWIRRVKFEYFTSKKLSKQIKPDLWFSLHDMTPNVDCKTQVVYCHNPSPFYKLTFKEKLLDIKFALFNAFYKYLYQINIKRNRFVIVQQNWLRDEFIKLFGVNTIVAYPLINNDFSFSKEVIENDVSKFSIFYPSFPRIFKNFEVLLEAGKILSTYRNDFEIIVTIRGDENKYAISLFERYKQYDCIKFVGKLTRNQVYNYYNEVACLAFPSKLETWGLPISEFKQFNKPILAANLPYAKETVGEYGCVKFFDSTNAYELAEYLSKLIDGNLEFDRYKTLVPAAPFASNWAQLFDIILQQKDINT
ncbi:glycosyltransferase [Mucilaginibacter ximonensis]|uniref:Glycosyltransferase n=1 Tax=Mucilaginibacter ximonensis TaxID=538021 RepID=A0ABW5YEY1_9SPHI